MKRRLPAILALSLFVCVAGSIHAAPIKMTDPTFSSPVNNQRELVSFQCDGGGVVYTPEAIASTITDDSNLGWNLGDTNTVGEPANGIEALGDAYVTTNIFGLGRFNSSSPLVDVDFSLNTTVNAGDGRVLYLVEHAANGSADDNILVEPMDENGVIAGWSLTLNSGGYGTITTTAEYDWKNQGHPLAGTTFTLADFTGGTSMLTGVTGLRIHGEGLLDPAQIGVAVPEPASISLVAFTLSSLAFTRRRRREN